MSNFPRLGVFTFLLPGICLAQGAAPSIFPGGVASASAFGKFTAVAPGSWIEIYGANLAADTRSWTGADFSGVNAPASLDGTSVSIGGQAAFVAYISPGQVNAQVSSTVGTGSQNIVVTTAAGSSAPYSITVNLVQPGLLAPASFAVAGKQYVAALFPDGATYVLPSGAIAGVASRRAQPGDVITFYGVGFGPVTPTIPAGQTVEQSNSLALPFNLMFGSSTAAVLFQGLAPQAIGLYQFNVVVPAIATSDLVPVTFNLGGVAGTQTLYIAVQGTNTPVTVQSVTLSASSVAGGGSVQGTVNLSAAAPAGGAAVNLSSTSAFVSIPATVTVLPGATSATFPISTSTVTSSQTATITAAYGTGSVQTALTITPPSASALPKFSVLTVVGSYEPSDGSPSSTFLLQITPNSDGTFTASDIAALGTFKCTLSGSSFTSNTFQVFSQYASLGLSTAGSLSVDLTPGSFISTLGAAKGTINFMVSGLPPATAAAYNKNGTFTGTYTLLQ